MEEDSKMKEKQPLVSVIIPTYNRERTIERAIQSVLHQTYQNIECIVVDDCSTDNTDFVVNNIKDLRLKYVKQPINGGACAARNRGLDMAQGEYIAFQDSDDEFRVNKIERQLYALLENDADVVFCAIRRHGLPQEDEFFPDAEQGFKSHRDIVVNFYVSTQMIFGKRSVFEKYRFDEQMPRLQDYDLMVRVAETEKVYFLKEELADVYLQEDSLTFHIKNYQKEVEVTTFLLKKYSYLVEKYPEWYLDRLKYLVFLTDRMGEHPVALYKELSEREPSKRNKMKYVLARIHLLKLYYKIKQIREKKNG